MFQPEVEEKFFLQTGAFIVTWWEVIAGVPDSNLPLAHILCPAVPFKTAPALESFLSNISSAVCSPVSRALLRLVAHCLPCRESASREAQPFPTKPTIKA